MNNGNGRTILLVEDEAILAMDEKMKLEKYGYSVRTVATGEKAVEAVENASDIDLILMDINLGSGMDGTEAAERILKTHHVPIVFVSSHTEPEIVEKTEKITSYGYIVKNSSITVFDASIKMAFKLFEASINIRRHQEDLLAANRQMSLINENLQRSEARLIKSESAVRGKLKAIMEPEGGIDRLELSDIIDSQSIQSLMEDFFGLTGILGAILDTKGKILVAVGWQDICTKFHRCHPITARHCKESDTALTEGVAEGAFKLYRCKNNMWDMVTPLVIDNVHVGNIFIGQFIFEGEEPDVELYRQQARTYGFDETGYLEALARVPRFTRKTVETGMSFYAKVARIVSSLSYSSVKLARTNEERRKAEEKIGNLLTEKELLLKEVHHRIKNNMNTISSLLSLQANSVADQSAVLALQDAGNRIQSISLLYDKLYRSPDYGEMPIGNYLSPLVEEVVANFPAAHNVDIETDFEAFPLDVKRLQSLGIMVNELLTNTMKHAFVGRDGGRIRVSAIRSGARLKISVEDDGRGIPESVSFDKSTGFGLQLVRMLAEQLEGTIRLERGDGTRVVLEFTP